MLEVNMTKTFITGPLKKHREDVLLLRERSLLPATQVDVERYKLRTAIQQEIVDIKRQITDLKRQFNRAQIRLYRVDLHDQNENEIQESRTYTPCPVEDCRGFVTERHTCGICGVTVCSSCHEIKVKDVKHTCDDGVVANIIAIRKDSKPCPSCHCMIFRIEGCDQMFCTKCNTPFSWKTLKIVTGRAMHNPHYYEYMANRGQGLVQNDETEEVMCANRMPTMMLMTRTFATMTEQTTLLLLIHRFTTHVSTEEFDKYPSNPDIIDPAVNHDVRVRFLMNEIDEKKFKEILQQREKRRKKMHTIRLVLETFVAVSTDAMRNIVATRGCPAIVDKTIQDMEELRKYVNASLADVSKRYDCVVPIITRTWRTPLACAKV
jgi:hypothetical protein